MDTKKIAIGVFAATTIVLAVIAFKAPAVITIPRDIKIDASSLGAQKTPIVNVPAPIVNVAAPNVTVQAPKQSQTFGSATSPEVPSPYFCTNAGIFANCKYTVSGNFMDATNTLAMIANPFNATSTVTFISLKGTNGTTTVDLIVGTTTLTAYEQIGTTTVSQQSIINNIQISPSLINATIVATSTIFYSVNGIRYGTGVNDAGAGSQTRIVIGPSEAIGILATSTYVGTSATGNQGITNSNNSFSGSYLIEFQN